MTDQIPRQRTAIVTGAARGIGAAVAKRSAQDGFVVGVIDLSEADCAATVEAITINGGSAIAISADVNDEAAVTAAVVSDMTRATARRLGLDFEEHQRIAAQSIPVGRIGSPEDVAHTASYLVSAEAGFVSGQVSFVAGGSVD